MQSKYLDDKAYKLFKERYAKDGEQDWNQLCDRVSKYICGEDKKLQSEVYDLLIKRIFLFNSPALMNAGRSGTLSACFVLGLQDSMQGIFKTLQEMAIVQKNGGGTGFDFSVLREKGAEVSTTNGKASGVISFMKVFNNGSHAVEQGGIRRAANMAVLACDHPELEDFITFKAKHNTEIEKLKQMCGEEYREFLEEKKELTYFNLSVSVTDEFMHKVQDYVEKGIDSDWSFISRKTGNIHHTEKISKIWNLICTNAHDSGDPGILFIDTVNKTNPIKNVRITATNPCGELPLFPYESCNLGSIDVSKLVIDGKLDEIGLKRVVDIAVQALDRVIDVNNYPIPEIKEATQNYRKLGLGVMGIADALFKLKIPYGSDKAVDTCERIMGTINDEAVKMSKSLGEAKGNFPEWKNSIYADKGISRRNATVTTVAPTGSISILAGCSSGIEPVFGLAYSRDIKEVHADGKYSVDMVNPILVDTLKARGLYSDELISKIAKNDGRVKGLGLPEDIERVFVTAFDIAPEQHLRMQQAFQRHVENSISKTINMPNSATVEDISKVYLTAWKMGLKGVTIYRDGSLDSQVLNLKSEEKSEAINYTPVKARPALTKGYTVKLHSGCCDMNATLGFDEQGKLFEVRISNAKGGCSAMYAGLGMMTSEALRLGGDPKRISEQLRQVICPACTNKEGLHGKSCPDLLGKIIEKALEGQESVEKFVTKGHLKTKKKKVEVSASLYSVCPSCGNKTYYMESGCGHCIECGYSNCK
jgi:ribonucleoside-diphosphate reductase alpha chain